MGKKRSGLSNSTDIMKYFRREPQPSGESLLACIQVQGKTKMPPCHREAFCAVGVMEASNRLQVKRKNRFKTPRASASLGQEESPSELNGVIIISDTESGISSEDTPYRSRLGRDSAVRLAQVTTAAASVNDDGVMVKDVLCRKSSLTADLDDIRGNQHEKPRKKLASVFTRKWDTDGEGESAKRSSQPSGKPAAQLRKSNMVPINNQEQVVNESISTPRPRHSKPQTMIMIMESMVSGWREDLSGPVVKCLLEEIGTSNPQFPFRRVFTMLQKKYKESLPVLACTETEMSLNPRTASLPCLVGEKRKRQRETEGREKVLKRQRSSLGVEEATLTGRTPPAEPWGWWGPSPPPTGGQHRGSRLSRTHRLKQQQEQQKQQQRGGGGLTPAGVGPELKLSLTNQSESTAEDCQPQGCLRRDHSSEDVQWTDKYCPRHSTEVMGNSAPLKRLHCWLKKWKLRADCEERRKEREKKKEDKKEDNSNDSWDCSDFQGEAVDEEEGEEDLCNTMLITGPLGVGKTASVYACAQELGFKVFEVNASSQRCGRHVLSQLKEATQSHQVETQGHAPLKPAYLSGFNTAASTKSDTLPGKVASPRKVISSSRKVISSSRKVISSSRKGPQHCASARRRGGGVASVTLANFFKMKSKPQSLGCPPPPPKNQDGHQQNISSLKTVTIEGTDTMCPESPSNPSPHNEGPTAVGQSRRSATSLILFEEVDVIFDDDVGFLAAIKTFMTTTKRPVVLTTNDPSFSAKFDGNFEEIIFKTPSMVNVCSYLQLLCLAENVRTDPGDITSLLSLNQGDLRRTLLQLQLWVRSGGGRASQRAALLQDPTALGVAVTEGEPVSERLPSHLPPCDEGCTPSMLGLLSSGPIQDLRNILECKSWAEPEVTKLTEVLTESWRRGVPLLYSNLELLLPLPPRPQETPVRCPEEVPPLGLGSEPTPPGDTNPQVQELLGQTSPARTASRLRRRKRIPTPDSRPAHSEDETLKSHGASLLLTGTPSMALGAKDDRPQTEKRADGSKSHSLVALTDFIDLMSFMDACMPIQDLQQTSGAWRPGAFVWTGADLKDGLLDELGEEEEEVDGGCSWGWRERSLEIQAALEVLGFQRCQKKVSKGRTGAQGMVPGPGEKEGSEMVAEKHKLPGAPHTFSFSQISPCKPSVVQRRYETSRAVLSSRAFCALGNRPAVTVDYMPALRSVCRSERAREQGKGKPRFLHYLSSIHLGLLKSAVQLLSNDFP